MPQLDEKQYAKFSRMLAELEPEIDAMKEAPANFVRDQIERNKEYGESMFVSPKQFAWMERLHEEFVGDTEHAQPKGVDGKRSDMDDDIPF